MKWKAGMLLLIGCILVGTGALVYQYNIKPDQEGKVIEKELVEKLCILKGNIVRIEVRKDGTTILEKHNGQWQNPLISSLEYDEGKIHNWLVKIRALESLEAIYRVEDLASYGIDENAFTLTFYDDTNDIQTYRVGKVSNGVVYLMCDQLEGIFTISLEQSEMLQSNLNDFVEGHIDTPDVKKIDRIQLLEGNKPGFSLIKMNMPEHPNWVLSDYYKSQHPIQQEVMESLLNEVDRIELKGFVGIMSEQEDYGLEEPQYKMVLNDSWSLSFGKSTEQGVYVRQNEEIIVYEVDKVFFNILSDLKPFDMISKQILDITPASIREVVLENPKDKYVLSLQEEKAGSKKIVGKLNDKVLDDEQIGEIVTRINESICLEAVLQNPEIEQKEARKAEITIRYSLVDHSKAEIELIPYDINYYILRYNGNIEFAVNKDKVIKLFSMLHDRIHRV